ncbi:hypothetical protein [Phenylobacterium sp.]|uniref:hypothetical protein n=1 Tax=Phenylobacterium sp. TaxID=1871053 RepID=UPI0011F93758|nr:hypothetical protein [Phenylobacterium sp.]THD59791.1 MAG: hypothetical protein E8A49_15905 [Phenylobacterium sp.]
MARTPDKLTDIVIANDKLLKAMIALLALKDRYLLDELRVVFDHVHDRDPGNEVGLANRAVWAHIREELNVIADMVGDEASPDTNLGEAGAHYGG